MNVNAVAYWAIIIIVIIAILGIVNLYITKSGIAIPDWLRTGFWIIVAAILAILAIKILLGMA